MIYKKKIQLQLKKKKTPNPILLQKCHNKTARTDRLCVTVCVRTTNPALIFKLDASHRRMQPDIKLNLKLKNK